MIIGRGCINLQDIIIITFDIIKDIVYMHIGPGRVKRKMIFLKFQEKRYFGASYEGEVFAITGSRFSQRVQSIVVASFSMQEDLGKRGDPLSYRIIYISEPTHN